MKARFKKMLSLALTMLFALSAVPFTALNGSAATTYAVGDIIEFGGYPQSRVTDSNTVAALNAKVKDTDWVSYGYYSGAGAIGSMEQGDWMKYCDIYLNGNKYRGVKFTQYRPFWSYNAPTTEKSQQDNNNYFTNTNYWFKWESLRWRILDPAAGLVMSESIIDAQPFQNEVVQTDNLYYVKNKPSVYANNYVHSTVRTWLNNDFYLTAFADAQQAKIKTTTLNNEMYNTGYPQYSAGETNDKIFLLSVLDSLNTSYGFDASQYTYDGKRQAQGTPYAVCQGIGVDNNRSIWTLRIASTLSERMKCMGTGGHLHDSDVAKINGIRPAFTFANGAIQFSPFAVDCDHTNSVFVDNGDGTHTKRCAFCDLALEEAAPHGCGRVYSSSDEGHLTDCPDCGVRFTYAHDDKGSVTTIPGTCVTPGQIKYRCSVTSCPYFGRTEETGFNAANHEGPYTYQEAVAATCSSSGSTRGQLCTACNQWKVAPQTTDPDLTNHVNTENVDETFSTCVNPGYTAGVFCNDCQQYVSGHEEKALAPHDWDYANAEFHWDGLTCTSATVTCINDESHTTDVDVTVTSVTTVTPGCESVGEKIYTASFTVGENVYTDPNTKTETLGATGHLNTTEAAETFSTCMTPGYTAGVYCNDCKTWISGHVEKALSDQHVWSQTGTVTTPATCSEPGKTTYTCTVPGCNATDVRTDVSEDPNNHADYGTDTENAAPAYCYRDGYTGDTVCARCRAVLNPGETIPKDTVPHAWDDGTVTLKPTCSATGTMLYRCTVKSCDATKEEEIKKDPDAHDLKVTVIEPTCTEGGYTLHACTLCRYGYTDDEQPALGHSWSAPEWKWSGTNASATFTCANGDHPAVVNAAVTVETVKEPTDTEKGLNVYTATVEFDGKTYTDTLEKSIPSLNEGLCKWCGERHDNSFGGRIKAFFHNILYFFAHLFGRK
ncbi:MAG: hypothetical protein IJK89_00635 [Clostridia bacterium]|nr:hypothetical protein [Clostridia bacterium]